MLNGIINVYKEKGYTSHDVVAKLRGILGQKKIGHTGTLDPDAEGVLPVCLGKATKLCDLLTDKDKTYEAVLKLGTTTDTQDLTGKVLQNRIVTSTKEEITEAVYSFIGEYHQIPPMYSALKVGGKKLYELAREGIEIERKPRLVYIHRIDITKVCEDEVTMIVTCSKGTYIRTLCNDIGEKLGCGGSMKNLLRTRVSRFQIENSLKLSTVIELKEKGMLESHIVKIDDMFLEYQSVTVLEEFTKFLYNGNILRKEMLKHPTDFVFSKQVRIYDSLGNFVGLYEPLEENNTYKPVKMFI